MSDRSELTILGRTVGTYTGWDEAGDYGDCIFYDVIPDSKYPSFPSGDVAVMLSSGVVETYDEDGNVTFTGDIIEILNNVV